MGEDAFGFGSDPFDVMAGSSRPMDDFHQKSTKSVNSSGTASTRSSTSTSGSRVPTSSREDRRRGVRKSKSGEGSASQAPAFGSGPFGFDDTPAPAPAPKPAANPPPRARTRRRASIGVPAAMPPQLAPSPAAFDNGIHNHFERSGAADRRHRFVESDVQSTASGQIKSSRAQNPRRVGRRASLASGRPTMSSTRSFDAPRPSSSGSGGGGGGGGGFEPSFDNAFGGGSNNNADMDYGYGDTNTQDYGYGYEDHAPSSNDYGYEDHAPSGNDTGFGAFDTSFDAFGGGDFGGTSSQGIAAPRRGVAKHAGSSRELAIKTPKRSSLGVLPTAHTPQPKPVHDDHSFDFDLSMPASTPSVAASRTQNIMLPTVSAPAEKAPRPRRRASLMGNISDTINAVGGTTMNVVGGTLNVVGGTMNAVGGVVTGNKGSATGEKLGGDEKKSSRSNKSSSQAKSSQRRKSNDAGAGIGISAYDADRDRRRMFG